MNSDVRALTGDDFVVNEVVLQYAPEFAVYGFEFKEVTLNGSQELVQSPVFHFLNERSALRIDILFSAAVQGRNGGFTALIVKPENRKLDVEDYLKTHERETLTKYFTYRDPATDIRSFADTFLRMFVGLLDRDLRPILEGKNFEETPIDWMGYK